MSLAGCTFFGDDQAVGDQHDRPTVALDPLEISRVERIALRQAILGIINECARAMSMPKQPAAVLGRLKELVVASTAALEELAQAG